ncbi:unnamed protein product [Peronospora effusa]|uniref:Peptidase S33 tripeptidyl aminopeptidase-like C-terminal domain-containing protein n=2 Tax=Peronospora effusa TaxID=542832 RepID=A0A3R8CJX0_9STRA|nr:hypothetical protein DD237_006841 [Peronospora effusa]CAI5701426.1 unnamed protein product [Peronospora effusa]
MMPLCYEGICDAKDDNATIVVSFKRIGSNNTSVRAKTVWYLPDRPDLQTREEIELQMALLYEELNRGVDINTLDMRGTGNSTALTCSSSIDESPLQNAIFARNDEVLNFSDVQACASRLHDFGYSDLSAFSLASVSRDVEKVITHFQPTSQVVVYALGYGTLVAQKLLQRPIPQVVGYVFDGALGGLDSTSDSAALPAISYQISKSDEDFGQVAAGFLTWCQLDADCSTKFSNVSSTTTLNTTLVEVYSRLDADPTSMCAMILMDVDRNESSNSAITPPSYLLRQLLGLMIKDTALWPFVPVVVYRFHRCGSEDLSLLRHFVYSTFKIDAGANTPELIYAIQAFSELWEVPSPNQALLTERFTNQAISCGTVYTQLEAYCLLTLNACMNDSASANLLSGKPTLSYANKPTNAGAAAISSKTSVLVFSGGLDVLAPPKYAAALFGAVQTVNKELLVAPYGTHGVVQTALLSNGSSCARRVLASFVKAGGNLSAYDASCMAALSTPGLAVSMSSSLLVLGVQDAYDGVLVNASISTDSTGSADILTDYNNTSNSITGPTLDQLNHRISTLQDIRQHYQVALIVVSSILGTVMVFGTIVVIYQRHRKQQLKSEETIFRLMRGDEGNEIELMRSISLLSNSLPSSDRQTETVIGRAPTI